MRLEFIQLYDPKSGRTYRFHPDFSITFVEGNEEKKVQEEETVTLVGVALLGLLKPLLKKLGWWAT